MANETENSQVRQEFSVEDFDSGISKQIVEYAQRVSDRGFVYNTLGNIAIRQPFGDQWVCYTKRKGISLEEMTGEDVIVKGKEGELLYGNVDTSGGNALNLEIFKHRSDVNAVIHLHPNSSIALYGTTGWKEFRYISADAPLVLGSNPYILEPEVNVEQDVQKVHEFIEETDSFIMPNHGITTLGEDISQAYHRMTTIVAEIDRIIESLKIYQITGNEVQYLSEEEKEKLYSQSREFTRV